MPAATALHPCIEQFRAMSVELLGDTGAANDIGPLQALQQQGIDPEVLQPWISCLQNPVRFATGGGPQTSHEELTLYAKRVGDLKLHLLENCPLAMSIGQQFGVLLNTDGMPQEYKTMFQSLLLSRNS